MKKILMKLSERFICKHLILLSRVWDIFQYIFLSLSINLSHTCLLNKCLMTHLYFFLTVWFILCFVLHSFVMCDRSLLWCLHLQTDWLRLSAESDFNDEEKLSLNLNTDLTEREHLTEEKNTNSANFLKGDVKAEEMLNRKNLLWVYLHLFRKSSRTSQLIRVSDSFKMSFFESLEFTFFSIMMQDLTAARMSSLHLLQVSLQWDASESLSLTVILSFDLMMCTQSLNFVLERTFTHLLKGTADIFNTAFWQWCVKTAMSSSSVSLSAALSLSSSSWEEYNEDKLSLLSLFSVSDRDSSSVLNM